MTKRYFKSTDGTKTIFRASERHYQFGRFTRDIGFCNTPGLDRQPATEITKAEHDRLVALKAERIRAEWLARCEAVGKRDAEMPRGYSSGPQDSFILNTQLEG